MAVVGGHQRPCFLGIDFQLTRLFHSLLSPVPAMPPPLNDRLRVLIIADPCAQASLAGARDEGLAVLEALLDAQEMWGDEYTFRATIRIGPAGETETTALRAKLEQLLKDRSPAARQVVEEGARGCEPLELLSRIVNGEYDVIHYAGHGIFDKETNRMGWVFDQDCVLSAEEIFRVRQVPRLVFANACFSGLTGAADQTLRPFGEPQVGLAQAFFARGIQNFIGTGWAVQDQAAQDFARHFYRQVLGIIAVDGREKKYDTAPPATLGSALSDARRAILEQGPTWGAYQHYGQSNAKLLPFRNRDERDTGPAAAARARTPH
jgi:hypothetical protein